MFANINSLPDLEVHVGLLLTRVISANPTGNSWLDTLSMTGLHCFTHHLL